MGLEYYQYVVILRLDDWTNYSLTLFITYKLFKLISNVNYVSF
jgi:hypothetical protein